MKWLLLFLLMLPLASAIDMEFHQDSYAAYETVVVKINFTEEDVVHFEPLNVKVEGVNVVGEKIVQIDSTLYYVSFYLLGIEEGEHNFKLEQVTVREEGLVKKDYSKTFNVVKRDSASIRPGLVYMRLDAFEQPLLGFEIDNKGGLVDFDLSVEGDFLELSDDSIKVNPKNSKMVKVGTRLRRSEESYLEGSFNVKYGDYEYKMPIILERDVPEEVEEEEEVEIEEEVPEDALVFDVVKNSGSTINLVLNKDETKEGDMFYRNDYTGALTDISFKLEGLDVVEIKYTGDGVLDPGELEFVHLIINSKKSLTKDYSGNLIVSSNDVSASLPINIKLKKVVEEVAPIVEPVEQEEEPKEEKTSYAVYIVSILLLIIVVGFVIAYMKGRKQRENFSSFVSRISR